MKSVIAAVSALVLLMLYTMIGTANKVDAIRAGGEEYLTNAGFVILRGEGYQYGSWGEHGGKVWYHVAEKDNPHIRYRVYLTMWNGELHSTYGEPEVLDVKQIQIEN